MTAPFASRRALRELPALKRVFLHADNTTMLLHQSWRDPEQDRARTTYSTVSLLSHPPRVLSMEEPPATVVAKQPSPSLRRWVCLVASETPVTGLSGDSSKLRVEVWDVDRGLITSTPVDKTHGAFCAGNETFGGVAWHESEAYVAYVAERTPTSSVPKYNEAADWGEQNEGVSQPALVLFSIDDAKAKILGDSTRSEGEPVFRPGAGLSLAYTSWSQEPFRLGVVYCQNRKSEVRVLSNINADIFKTEDAGEDKSIPATFTVLPKNSWAARSPRWSPDGKKLAFIYSEPIDVHSGPVKIAVAEGTFNEAPTTIFDAKPVERHDVPVYAEKLPAKCWTSDSKSIWLTSTRYLRRFAMRLSATNDAKKGVPPEAAESSADDKNSRVEDGAPLPLSSSCAVLMVDPSTNRVMVFRSTPSDPGSICWLPADSVSSWSEKGLQPFYNLTPQKSPFPVRYEILDHKIDGKRAYSSLLIRPDKPYETNQPLVVFPHGGPHSTFTTDFSADMSWLTWALNSPILFVNYRGSTGESLADLMSLPGRAGEQDVEDVQRAAVEVVAKLQSDPKRIAILGGSHGGFLAAHLSARFPEYYSACVMRNPVVDLPGMLPTTDISDWVFTEGVGDKSYDFDGYRIPTGEQLEKMRRASPISYLAQAASVPPTMVHLGDKDRRVPPSQGLSWHRGLLGKGATSRLHRFPQDTHAIDRPASNEFQWNTSVEFVLEQWRKRTTG